METAWPPRARAPRLRALLPYLALVTLLGAVGTLIGVGIAWGGKASRGDVKTAIAEHAARPHPADEARLDAIDRQLAEIKGGVDAIRDGLHIAPPPVPAPVLTPPAPGGSALGLAP